MSLILKQESIGNVPTPVAGKSVVFVDTTGQLGVKQSSGTTVVTGNITAVNLDGNVSNVLSGTGTWIAAGSGSSYGNSNVVTLMSNFGSNTIVTTGNITAGNLITSGASGNISGANVISATTLSASGNVNIGSYIVLNGSTSNISGIGSIDAFYLTTSSGVYTSFVTATNGISVSGTVTLGSVSNVVITGGSSGQVLSTDGAGNLSWATQSGGSANLESVSTDVLPSFDSVFDLGSTTKRWDNLNLATSANINGSVLTGTTVGNSATLTTNAVLVADSVVATSALLGDVSIISNTISALDYYGNVSTLSVIGNIAVGNVANVIIPGGTSGQVLSTDGAGNLSWTTSGGTATAVNASVSNVVISGGSSGQVLSTDGSGTLSWVPRNALTLGTVSGLTYVTSSDNGKIFMLSFYGEIYMPTSPVDVGFSFQVYTANTGSTFYIYSGNTVFESGTGGTSHSAGAWNVGMESIVTLTYVGSSKWVANYK